MPKKAARKGPGRPAVKLSEKARGVAISLPPDVLNALDRRRKRDGLTRSAAVSEAIRQWLTPPA